MRVRQMKLRIVPAVQTLLQKGFFHILGTGVLNKIISLASNIVITRVLTKNDFGIYSYASNISTIFLLFSGLGMATAVLQYGSENRTEAAKNSVYRFSLQAGMAANGIISLAMLIYGLFWDLSIPAGRIPLIVLSVIPVFDFSVLYLQSLLRAQSRNRQYALMTNINSAGNLLLVTAGAYFFGIVGAIGGRYLAYVITLIYTVCITRDDLRRTGRAFALEHREKWEVARYALIACFSTGMSQALYLVDVYIIGRLIPDPEVIASYKAATLIPFNLNFLPSSVMIYIYPYFASRNHDRSWLKKNSNRIFLYMGVGNAVLAAGMFLFAPWIIRYLYGDRYADAVQIFRLLSLTYFVTATFRIPSGNILAMMRRIHWNLMISVFSGLLAIVFDIWLVGIYGSIGAAYSNMAVVTASGICSFFYLQFCLKQRR